MSGLDRTGLGADLAATAAAALAVLLAAFAVAVTGGRHRVVDVVWGLAFAVVAVVATVLSAGAGNGARRLLLSTATVVWGLRLAAHLARRGRGEDPRYEKLLAIPACTRCARCTCSRRLRCGSFRSPYRPASTSRHRPAW